MDQVRHMRLVHEESRARYVTLLDMDCQERSQDLRVCLYGMCSFTM